MLLAAIILILKTSSQSPSFMPRRSKHCVPHNNISAKILLKCLRIYMWVILLVLCTLARLPLGKQEVNTCACVMRLCRCTACVHNSRS